MGPFNKGCLGENLKKCIILLSGGLDSSVLLAKAKEQKLDCLCLSFNYHQKHSIELKFAKQIAKFYEVPHKIITIDQQVFSNSPLILGHVESTIHRGEEEILRGKKSPFYVPSRNTLFLSHAITIAEIEKAAFIYFGPTAMDKAFPDCQIDYIRALQTIIDKSTQIGLEGNAPIICTPLINFTKDQVVAEALRLKVPIHLTWSCYTPDQSDPCQVCDACVLRKAALLRNQVSL
ncbi:7-cyano-7-deazaguanine synthase [Candidatus Rubidus massiliensis]|nr:7-cyano-7-deazaguanine synthase [Candidatus Rubidus massiliensis]